MTDPESANVFKRETRRNLHKIQTQADNDHANIVNTAKHLGEGESAELQLIAGEILKTKDMATDMEGH